MAINITPKKNLERGVAKNVGSIYKGIDDGSKVPAEWHAWLHYTVDQPLSEKPQDRYDWQKDHLPNLTGTKHAYKPQGHDLAGGKRSKATGDYDSWSPAD